MDIRKIKKLIELLEESGIAEIEIKEGEEAVRISRMPAGGAVMHPMAAPAWYRAGPARLGSGPRCGADAAGGAGRGVRPGARARAPRNRRPTST